MIPFKNGGRNKVCDIAQLCSLMQIIVKMALPISLFFLQKMRYRYLGNYQKIFSVLTNAKNEKLGPSGPPLMQKKFNEASF